MIFLEEMKNLKVYSKPFFLPMVDKEKYKGSTIFLLTPNYESSKKTMNLPYLINRRYFQSYYIEKNINYIIKSGFVQKESYGYLNESFESDEALIQSFIDMKNTEAILESFDISDKDKEIVEAFKDGKVSAEYLTNHLKYVAKKPKYKRNAVFNDIKKQQEFLKTQTTPDGTTTTPSKPSAPSSSTDSKDNDSENKSNTGDELVENFLSNIDESLYLKTDNLIMFSEDARYDTYLKKFLYNDRIKQDKQILDMYAQVKLDNNFIKYTYTTLPRYKSKNIYYDLSFYNDAFFRNNNMTVMKSVGLYIDLLERLLDDTRLKQNGYTKKTIFIPIQDWNPNNSEKLWMYKEGINPISVIFRMLTTNPMKVKSLFKNTTVVFMTNNRYFKVDFDQLKDFNQFNMKFKKLIGKLAMNEVIDSEDTDDTASNVESPKAIKQNIVDKLEDSQGIKVNNLTGTETKSKKEIEDKLKSGDIKASDDKELTDKRKEELIQAIDTVAGDSINTDDALDKLESDQIKKIIIDLASQEEEAVKINNARTTRMMNLQNDMMNIKINNKTVKDLLNQPTETDTIPSTDLTKNITTTNVEEWSEVKFTNFDKNYDINSDIVKIFNKLSNVTYPIAIRDIKVTDNSTSEDRLDLYTVQMEDFRGKRFTVKLDIPRFRNDKYLLLRGNEKTIQNQFANMPIIKTDEDTCQIISNYNKIFVRRFGTAAGKSYSVAGRLLKTFEKYDGTKTKISFGDCSKVSSRYELPIDYIDIGSVVAKIENERCIFYFDQDELRRTHGDKIDISKGIPVGIFKKTIKEAVTTDKEDPIIYYRGNDPFSVMLLGYISSSDDKLNEIFNSTKNSIRYTYSKCSILNTEIPLIVVCAYCEGLENVLKKAGIGYRFVEKLDKETRNDIYSDYIRFNDGYIVYNLNYSSSLLMNGLKECDTMGYSLADINSKSTYLDFLDNFGGRIKADGITNFYDCMIDPITEEVLEHYQLPTDFIETLIYSNNLLSDNKFIKHTDTSSRRLRRKELIAVKVYKAIFNDAYASYSRQLMHSRNAATFTVKQSAVIDLFMTDCTSSDYSIINAINDVETSNAVTTKGESGLNSERSYSLDKRTYDESMLNLLGMSTGFAGNVGITRQATIDMNIDGKRGYIKAIDGDTSKLNDAKTLTITEALNPMGTTSDDPMRTAMNFIQTAKHAMRTDVSDPLLVSNGADEAMAYLVSDTFAFKAKNKGTIIDVTDKYILVEYEDKTKEYVNLEQTIEKNSDGGFYVPMKLSPYKGIKVGKKVNTNDIIAYDTTSFSNKVGEDDNLSYNVGTLAKIAIMNTDEGFEDSTILTETICEKMATDVIVKEERVLLKDTNIFNIVKIGQHVEEGETLLIYQNPYDEDDMNNLLKNLVPDENEISELGRIPIRSHVTGTVAGIKLYRTVELEELSPSLQKLFKDYEKPIKETKKVLDSNSINSKTLPASYKLEPIGKLKNAIDSVLIEIYVNVHDIIAVGDKIVVDRANKGVTKDIIPKGKEPYTEFRPNEEISCFANVSSFNKRMVTSPMKIGSMNKLLIELDRSCKDILGIPYDDSQP